MAEGVDMLNFFDENLPDSLHIPMGLLFGKIDKIKL